MDRVRNCSTWASGQAATQEPLGRRDAVARGDALSLSARSRDCAKRAAVLDPDQRSGRHETALGRDDNPCG